MPTPSPVPPSPWLTVNATARRLGKHRDTVLGFVSRGVLESSTLDSEKGAQVIISRASVDRHLAAQP